MTLDLDTFLTALYYFTDLLVKRHLSFLVPSTGPAPRLSPSEILTLRIFSSWLFPHSERFFLRCVRLHFSSYFPRLPSQSRFNILSNRLAPWACALLPALSAELMNWIESSSYVELIDGIGIKIMSLPRGRRTSLLPGTAAIGKDPTQDIFFFGIKLSVALNSAGLPTGFVFGPANTEERVLVENLFHERAERHSAPTSSAYLDRVLGPTHKKGGKRAPIGTICQEGSGFFCDTPYIVDNGMVGEKLEPHWSENYGISLLHRKLFAGREETLNRYRAKQLSGLRQSIESAFSFQQRVMVLKELKARTPAGVKIRVVSKLMAYAFSIALNRKCNRPPFSHIQPMALG